MFYQSLILLGLIWFQPLISVFWVVIAILINLNVYNCVCVCKWMCLFCTLDVLEFHPIIAVYFSLHCGRFIECTHKTILNLFVFVHFPFISYVFFFIQNIKCFGQKWPKSTRGLKLFDADLIRCCASRRSVRCGRMFSDCVSWWTPTHWRTEIPKDLKTSLKAF